MPQVLNYESFKARLEEIKSRRQRLFLFSDADETFTIKEHPTIYFEGETMRCGYTVKNRSLVEIPIESKTRPEVKYLITNENILAEIYQTVKGDLINKTLRVQVDSEGNAKVEILENNNQSESTADEKPEWWSQAQNLVIALGLDNPDDVAKVLIAQGWATSDEQAREFARSLLNNRG